MIEELRLVAQFVGRAFLGTELCSFDVGYRIRQARGPATCLEALRETHVEHRIFTGMPLRTHCRREHVVFQALLARREVAVRIGRIRERREPDCGGECCPARHVGTGRPPASRRLVVVAVEVRLAAFELLVVLRVARAQCEAEGVADLVVGVEVRRIRLGVDVIRHVVDVQRAAEGHEVVHEALFLEPVEARDVVELVVECHAGQLELLRELLLRLVVGHFLDGLGQTVEVDAHFPVDAARAGDRLERHRLRDIEIERDRSAPGIVTREARPGGVGLVDVAGVGVGEAPVDARCRTGRIAGGTAGRIGDRTADVARAAQRRATRRETQTLRARSAQTADRGAVERRGAGECRRDAAGSLSTAAGVLMQKLYCAPMKPYGPGGHASNTPGTLSPAGVVTSSTVVGYDDWFWCA